MHSTPPSIARRMVDLELYGTISRTDNAKNGEDGYNLVDKDLEKEVQWATFHTKHPLIFRS